MHISELPKAAINISKQILEATNKNTSEVVTKKEVKTIDELDRNRGGILDRYIRRTDPESGNKDSVKRKKGRELALIKKWGDKKYGLPEPRVKAVQREDVEINVDEAVGVSNETRKAYLKNAKLRGKEKTNSDASDYDHDSKIDQEGGNAVAKDRTGKHMPKNKNRELAKDYNHAVKTSKNKASLMRNASKVVHKEDVEINELSKSTLSRYVGAASRDLEDRSYDTGKKDATSKTPEYRTHKQNKRLSGVFRAANKLSDTGDAKVPASKTKVYDPKPSLVTKVKKFFTKESFNDSIDVEHDEFGIGVTIPGQYTNTTVDVLFDHGVETLSLEDLSENFLDENFHPDIEFHVTKDDSVKGKYSTIKKARSGVDKHDNNYGASVHSIKYFNKNTKKYVPFSETGA